METHTTIPTQERFYLVVKDNKFFIEWLDNDERRAFFPLFDTEEYEEEKQLSKNLFYPQSISFPLRHLTDEERASILASDSHKFP